MAVEVTERWGERKITQASDLSNWSAVRVFDVIGVSGEAAALVAVAGQEGVYQNSPHFLNPILRCTQLEVTNQFTVWTVTATFQIPTGGDLPGDPNPLRQPALINWRSGFTNELSEISPLGVPMINAAGDPFDPPSNLDFLIWTLTVRRNEPFYDPARTNVYHGAVNSDNFVIRGRRNSVAVQAGQARCMGIAPYQEYTLSASYVPVEYVFQFRESVDGSGVPADAWDIRQVNRGFRGWYLDGGVKKQGKITSATEPNGVTQAVLLDTVGKPLDLQSYKVNGQTPIANPNALGPPNVWYERRTVGSQVIYFSHFKRRKIRFNGLL